MDHRLWKGIFQASEKKENNCRHRGVKPRSACFHNSTRNSSRDSYFTTHKDSTQVQPNISTCDPKAHPEFNPKFNLWKNSDPIEDLTPIQSKRSYEIMQITNEKPKIDVVIEAHISANENEIKQKTTKSETQNPDLTGTCLQVITDWTTESCFCLLGRIDWNCMQ